jgi:tRNA dimethylallyltransferase
MNQGNEKSRNGPIRVPVILGPTAVGKSAIALAAAELAGAEILSCDSRQIYRGMDIGTAKPSAEERKRIPHWMVDIVDPDQPFSAERFRAMALAIIRERSELGKRLLICGGTGFYFRALSRGLGPDVGADPDFRALYEKKARESGPHSIFEELKAVDPASARNIHPHNVKRHIRALEVFHRTGRPLSEFGVCARPPGDMRFEVILCALPREILYARINARVDRMARDGLRDEFDGLLRRGYRRATPGMQCVGYRELFDMREGRISFHEALELIKRNTRRYAKRQMTWFAHQERGWTVDLSSTSPEEIIGRIIAGFNETQ